MRPIESRPLRVLMTTDTVGGVWHYSIDLARGLSDHGIETSLAAMGGHPSEHQLAQAQAVPGLRLHPSGFKLEWMTDPWEDVARAGAWLLELSETVRPHVVHLNNYAHGTLPWKRPVLMVGHSCVYSWFEHVRGEAPPGEWERYRRSVVGGLRAATAVTAPTWAMLDSLHTHYGAFRGVGPISNGCDGDGIAAREKLPLVVGAGRVWDEAKNLAVLDAVASGLPWQVCIAGDCIHPDGGVVELQHAEQLGRRDRTDVLGWFARASIFAHPARYEPFGLSALEAALSGCALVLGDISSLREVWGDAALYVRPDRQGDLRDAILVLIEDEGLRRDMAKSAHLRASRYSRRRMTDAYVSLYRDLLGIGRPAAHYALPLSEHAFGRTARI